MERSFTWAVFCQYSLPDSLNRMIKFGQDGLPVNR